jgi:hypothetical protein
MAIEPTSKERLGKALIGIGAVGFFLGLGGSFVIDSRYLMEPRTPIQATGHVMRWNSHYDVRYITLSESRWVSIDEAATFLMFGLLALGIHLTKNEKNDDR